MRLIFGLLLMLLPSAIWAENLPALYDVDGVDSTDTLNVRAGPSTQFEVIDKLASDDTGLEVVDIDPSEEWGMVNVGEQTGWVALRFMQRQGGQPQQGLPRALSCAGTEPFWSFDIAADKSATFSQPDQSAEIETILIVPSENRTDRYALFGDGGDKVFTSVIGRNLCSDGMSDRTYGLSIDLLVTDEDAVHVYSGCCSVAH